MFTGFAFDRPEFYDVSTQIYKDSILWRVLNKCVFGRTHEMVNYMNNWVARIFQRQHYEQVPTIPIAVGGQGTGKSTLSRLLRRLCGVRYCVEFNGTGDMTKRFNKRQMTMVVGVIEEIAASTKGGSVIDHDKLKCVTAADTVTIEPKGKEEFHVPRWACFLGTSNNKRLQVKIENDDRRYAPYLIDEDGALTKEEFADLYKNEFTNPTLLQSCFNYFAFERDITKFNPRNFPNTELRKQNQLFHTNPVKQFIVHAVTSPKEHMRIIIKNDFGKSMRDIQTHDYVDYHGSDAHQAKLDENKDWEPDTDPDYQYVGTYFDKAGVLRITANEMVDLWEMYRRENHPKAYQTQKTSVIQSITEILGDLPTSSRQRQLSTFTKKKSFRGWSLTLQQIEGCFRKYFNEPEWDIWAFSDAVNPNAEPIVQEDADPIVQAPVEPTQETQPNRSTRNDEQKYSDNDSDSDDNGSESERHDTPVPSDYSTDYSGDESDSD